MGLIRAIQSAVGGSLADQWLEVIEPDRMTDTTVFTTGVKVRKDDRRNQNRQGTEDFVTDGSVIHVYPNMFMLLVDGGKVIDYTAEEGYYKVDNASAPSLFNGRFSDALKESFNRVRYGGVTPTRQKVYFINLQEIKGIKFGTRNPVNYFDSFYNSELFLRAHGTYSVKITDPLRFYREAVPKDAARVDIRDINEQYLSEFLEALQGSINRMSAEGIRISYVPSKGRELSTLMQDSLDDAWKEMRGMEVQSVGIASISYDEESRELIHMRNRGAMLGDPAVREGYVQGSVARGIEAAGANEGGSPGAFIGMGMGMQTAGQMIGQASQANLEQMRMQQESREEPAARQEAPVHWVCGHCSHENPGGKFCSNCGTKRPEANLSCTQCGFTPDPNQPAPKFCPECGTRFPAE